MNTNFKWNDELVLQFVFNYSSICKELNNTGTGKSILDKFKERVRPEPLITTEDGVYYYANQRRDIYCISKYGNAAYKIDVHPEYYIELSKYYDVFFSSKTKAEKYIRWNKPCLSLSEVLTRYNCVVEKDNQFIECIKNLAKINIDK